ncbi:MAG: arginine deiminase-related protein [Bacteroidota bacterium]
MIQLNITDETSPLQSVVLGIGQSLGTTPLIHEAYDPKSRHHIKKGTYPVEEEVSREMEAFASVLEKYDVEVHRPKMISRLNQVFARDIGFTIEDRFIIPEILPDRQPEIEGIEHITDQIDNRKLLKAPKGVRIEGGDVMQWTDKIFIGYSKKEDFEKYIVARTNESGVDFLNDNFKDWEVYPFELNKSDQQPVGNALHLDCCFQPIGKNQAIVCPEGFKNKEDYETIVSLFEEENLIKISADEMYQMNSNIFSINEEVIVSEKHFTRLNTELRDKGFTVEEVPYAETSKMGGLFRCSTLPLRRTN